MGMRIGTGFVDDDWSGRMAEIRALIEMTRRHLMADNYMNMAGELIKRMETIAQPLPHVLIFDVGTPQTDQAITVDKRYYRIDIINETESSVDIRITRK